MTAEITLSVAMLSLVAPEAGGQDQQQDAVESAKPPPAVNLAQIVDTAIDTVGVSEPSGIAFDAARDSMFVVGDSGDIAELSDSKSDRIVRGRVHGDIEGVALRSGGGLYVIEERTLSIIEIEIEDLVVVGQHAIDPSFQGERLFDGSNDGAEGLVIVSGEDVRDGEPDRWFICRQGSMDPEHRPPLLLELVEVRQEGGATSFSIVSAITFHGVRDFAALSYDRESGRIIIVSDEENALYLYDLASGEARRAAGLPGVDQEGFDVDASGAWLIAQDSGGVIKMRPRGDLSAVWEVAVKVTATERVRDGSQADD